MATGIAHPFANFEFGPPRGEEDRVGTLAVFITPNKDYSAITSVTTCWELDDDEIAEIVRTKRVMMNSLGGGLMAHYITSPEKMREFVLDFGLTWPKENPDG